ncbi:DUF4275 family protein [Priestia endophytica]|uniref:DUF4275 family protein n=1 Tax=Priestia endophytica TaxID=135735 RepID=UPI003D27C660
MHAEMRKQRASARLGTLLGEDEYGERKDICYIFYQHSDHALIVKAASRITADDLIDETDIYVVNKDFNWTYVKTYETEWCGPYFSRKSGRL